MRQFESRPQSGAAFVFVAIRGPYLDAIAAMNSAQAAVDEIVRT
jgi:hypothetical protein